MLDPVAAGTTDATQPLFARRPYVLYLSGRFLGTLANTSQAVIIAWEVYELARRSMSVAEAAFAVGMIGLAQFLPLFCLTLVAGAGLTHYEPVAARQVKAMKCRISDLSSPQVV